MVRQRLADGESLPVVAAEAKETPPAAEPCKDLPVDPRGLDPASQIAMIALLHGASSRKAAALAGRSERWMYGIRQTALWQQVWEECRKYLWQGDLQRVEGLRGRALDRIEELLERPADMGFGYFYFSVLDRTGIPATKRVRQEVSGGSRNPDLAEMSSEEIREELRLLRGGLR